MKKTTSILSLLILALSAHGAIAKDQDRGREEEHHCRAERRCVAAPEIDPAQALGALSILAGSVAIVRGYRRRRK